MYNIYTTDMAFEQCASDKTKIDCIIPYAVLHFVLSGEDILTVKKSQRVPFSYLLRITE